MWMESSGGVLSAFFRPPDLTCHPRDFLGGKGEQKTTCFWVRNADVPEPNGDGLGNWQRSHSLNINNDNKREVERARWATATCNAIATALAISVHHLSAHHHTIEECRPSMPDFHAWLETAAQRYKASGHTLPSDWNEPTALPANGDEAQKVAQFPDGTPRLKPAFVFNFMGSCTERCKVSFEGKATHKGVKAYEPPIKGSDAGSTPPQPPAPMEDSTPRMVAHARDKASRGGRASGQFSAYGVARWQDASVRSRRGIRQILPAHGEARGHTQPSAAAACSGTRHRHREPRQASGRIWAVAGRGRLLHRAVATLLDAGGSRCGVA